MICECEDYKKNMPLIDEALVKAGGYSGKFMEYCPWCGGHFVEPPPVEGQGNMSAFLDKKHF